MQCKQAETCEKNQQQNEHMHEHKTKQLENKNSKQHKEAASNKLI